MITLYYRPTCPYSHKVMDEAEALGVPLDLRDVTELEHAESLLAKGGKAQVPFLLDDDTGTALYESSDIVAYLHDRYA